MITTRHGTPISIDKAGRVPTSFFEAELFEAALLQKPSFVFLLEGFEPPDLHLTNLLKLLSPFFPNMNLRPMSEDQIIKEIDRLVRHYERPPWLRRLLTPPRIGLAIDALFRSRHRHYDVVTEAPPLRFLGGLFDPSLNPPDPQDATNNHQHHVRLTLLWFAIRALMGAPYIDRRFRDFLHLWARAFEAWNSTSAWYGLHGHAMMGCLAALGSLTEIRMRLEAGLDRSPTIPHGPLASEYYSIARLAGRLAEILGLSLRHIDSAIAAAADAGAGELAIRASIYRELGAKDASLADYRKVVDLRKEDGGSYGEALSELGYAMFRFGEGKR